jgi:tetratricopeptide (TPR) repeat protein
MTPSTSSRRHRGPLPWLIIALVAALVAAPAAARADHTEEARAHVARATRAHKEGRYDEARVELEAAYALAPRSDLLYALGQVHARLGHCREAETYFRRYAATQQDPRVARVVDQAIAACQPAAAPAPAPAIDQPLAASTPPPAPPATDAPPPANPAPVPPASRPAAPLAAPRTAPAAVAPPPPHRWYQDKLGDGLVLGGIVAGAVGLIELRSAQSDLDAAEDRTRTTTLARYHDLIDSAHGKRTASIVLFGAGGALVVGGVVRYALHTREAEVGGVGVAPVRGGGVITYAGSL